MASDLVHSTPIDIDVGAGSLWEFGIRQDLPSFDKSGYPSAKRLETPGLSTRKKNLPTNGWKLSDTEFEKLNRICKFIVERWGDPSKLNRHGTLPYYSELNSLLDNDVSGKSIYCNPPWSLTIAYVHILRACRAKTPMDIKAVIVLPY